MRPSYDYDDYTAGKKGRKPIKADTPWGLLIVLLFSSSCALYTRQRSLTGDAITATRSLLEDDVHHDNPLEPTALTYREDLPLQKLAEAAFNPMHHELYGDLPPLQHLTEEQEEVRPPLQNLLLFNKSIDCFFIFWSTTYESVD
jgi:hypothetical protein